MVLEGRRRAPVTSSHRLAIGPEGAAVYRAARDALDLRPVLDDRELPAEQCAVDVAEDAGCSEGDSPSVEIVGVIHAAEERTDRQPTLQREHEVVRARQLARPARAGDPVASCQRD